MKILRSTYQHLKTFGLIFIALFVLILVCGYMLNLLTASKHNLEINQRSELVSSEIYQNLLILQSDILSKSQQLYHPEGFIPEVAEKIVNSNPIIVALEIRNSNGELKDIYKSKAAVAEVYTPKKSLPPWLLHRFNESLRTHSPVYSNPYNLSLLSKDSASDGNVHFLVEEFIPLIKDSLVLVVVMDPSGWLNSINPEKLNLKLYGYEIFGAGNTVIASTINHSLDSVVLAKRSTPFVLPGLSLSLTTERYSSSFNEDSGLIILEVLFCLFISGLLFGFIRTFIAKKNAEIQLQQQNEILLDNARLATLGEISSVLSHEINQPIAAIESYASAAEHLLNDESRRFDHVLLLDILGNIKAQGRRSGQIIQNVRELFFSRSVKDEVVSVNAILKKLTPIIAMQAERYHADFKIDYLDSCKTKVNPLLFEQVILNLTRNAFQAMAQVKPSRRQLKVDIKRSGKFVNLIFTDGGDGVSTEAAGNLFKSFYSTKPNGMGLGLSLSRTLIERFGGELSWRNLTDFGAEFTIRLPLVLE